MTRLAPRLPLLAITIALSAASAPALAAGGAEVPWWVWPAALFAVSFVLGIVAVLAGVGGAVLYVPIVSGFFPFHLDFVRGAGLMLALSGALAAGAPLLRAELASLRLAMPLALVGSIGSIFGAAVGLALPVSVVQTALGLVVLAIAAVMWRVQPTEGGAEARPDRLAAALGLCGVYADPRTGTDVRWQAHRTAPGLVLFAAIGFMAGMFGLGAGWANVPALNLVMGIPLKVAAASSGLMLSIIDTSAAWVYINRGAVLPLVMVPSVLGVMLGARIGARALRAAQPATVRRIVIALLLVAGGRALLKGVGA